MGRRVTVRALLDTHAFLWWLTDSHRLSQTARHTIADEANEIVFSAASAWEIATKLRLGRLPGGEAVVGSLADCVADQGFEALPIAIAEAERAGRLPGPHRDPFDRMLVAQAQARALAVISTDTVFDRYGVERLW